MGQAFTPPLTQADILSVGFESLLQLLTDGDPETWVALALAQMIGFLPPMCATRIVFPALAVALGPLRVFRE